MGVSYLLRNVYYILLNNIRAYLVIIRAYVCEG